MSSNPRQKPTKNRLSLRGRCTTKISKSPRRAQPPLGLTNHHPLPLSLNSNSSSLTSTTQSHAQLHTQSNISKTDIQTMSRSKSNITHTQNIINNQKYTSIKSKPKIIINKNWKSPNHLPNVNQHTPTPPHEHTPNPFDNINNNNNNNNNMKHMHLNDNINFNDSISDLFENKSIPPSNISDNLSGSSISDILGTMPIHHEDSDDEERTKAMLNKIDHLNLNKSNTKPMRKSISNPAISNMINNNNSNHESSAHKLFQKKLNNYSIINKMNSINTQIVNTTNKSISDDSPSSIASIASSNSHRYRSASSDGESSNNNYSCIKSVPEENGTVSWENGLMTYVGKDAQCTNYSNDNNNNNNTKMSKSKSAMSFKNIRRKKSKKGKKGKNNSKLKPKVIPTNESKNNSKLNQPESPGIICKIKLKSEWDCLTVSNDQKWVALFSRNSMALLKITEYGKFEQLRDLKAGRKESRLKYGAVDAQFYPTDASKLISCTRNGALIVLNLLHQGRGCVALNDCKLKQRVHKVTWIKNTSNVLAAAEDGNCYLWDTRVEGGLNGHFIGGKRFNKSTAALNCKISPFNDNLFASSHKNGTLNIWDIRNEKCPFLTVMAHNCEVQCIDWHPAIPNVMASCGFRDITIKIWNLTEDKVAQNKYYDFWDQLNKHRYYNYEDDYRLSADVVASPSCITDGYKAVSYLRPNMSMYPSDHVSQIGWRPCIDPKSLSANQIACTYAVGSQQVVEMWDIKSSYVPVARMSSHESETKFKFILKHQPYLDAIYCDMIEESESINNNDSDSNSNSNESHKYNNQHTYLITCSKDKIVKLTDCGFADIPRSHLSNCALDIAPFGNTCFVSVARQKLHPFDQETYHIKNNQPSLIKSSSMGELRKDSIDLSNDSENNKESIHLEQNKRGRSYSNNLIASDCECNSNDKKKGIFALFSKRNKIIHANNNIIIDENKLNNSNENENINAMSNGLTYKKVNSLCFDIFNDNFDAFSIFEPKLTCYPINDLYSISPCDNAITFKYLAKHYKLIGKSIPILCQQNEKIAENICNQQLKDLWNLLNILFKDISHNIQKINKKQTKIEKIDMISNSSSDNENNDCCWWMDNMDIIADQSASYNSSCDSHSHSHMSYLSINSHHSTPHKTCSNNNSANISITTALNLNEESDEESDDFILLISGYICDVINECIERGDIQTATTIIIILQKYINKYLNEEFIIDIILSYLDLLLHCKLLIEAVKIYNLTKHYKLINNYFETSNSNRLIIKCIRCKQTMRDYRCFKCNKIARCNQCNQSLINNNNNNINNKLLIWCQICGHGGHFNHMKEWFINQNMCNIDNCKHICQPVLIQIMNQS